MSTGSANPVKWDRLEEPADGLVAYRLASWSNFFDFIETEIFGFSETSKHDYIWRGQRRADWSLSSSLDRIFDKLGLSGATPLEEIAAAHLERFKYATRGRRGPNAADPESLVENEWWALGQHFGLATPLLDWTRSPFAAAYFAFEELATDATDYRVVYGLDCLAVKRRNEPIQQGPSLDEKKERPPVLDVVDPMYDENARLVSQGGLFTRAPIGVPVDQWIAKAFEGSPSAVLLRIEIPNADRLTCLRALNRMNINHLSLFPDLSGASRSTNLKLELQP
ncbi:MAG: FRG domain-containing protein [Terriglobales bacterium]